MKVRDLLQFIDQIAPAELAFSFDKIGLQIGSVDWPCGRIAVSLDSSLAAVAFARKSGANVLLSHHPLIWEPLTALDPSSVRTKVVMDLVRSDIAFIAAHTNWDCAPDGLNDELAHRLGLSEVRPFGSANPLPQYKIVVFVPQPHLQSVIDAMSVAGAGVIGSYQRCAYFSEGIGTFLGSEDTNPVIGKPGQIEEVEEARLEMRADERNLTAVVSALRKVHPYEEPAYDVVLLKSRNRIQAGRIGRLPRPMALEELEAHANRMLQTRAMTWRGGSDIIHKLAVVGGAADGDWHAALRAGAQAFLTGEIKQNIALEASESGLSMMAAGHYATEQPGCERLCRLLCEAGFDAVLFTPDPGQSGRPTD